MSKQARHPILLVVVAAQLANGLQKTSHAAGTNYVALLMVSGAVCTATSAAAAPIKYHDRSLSLFEPQRRNGRKAQAG